MCTMIYSLSSKYCLSVSAYYVNKKSGFSIAWCTNLWKAQKLSIIFIIILYITPIINKLAFLKKGVWANQIHSVNLKQETTRVLISKLFFAGLTILSILWFSFIPGSLSSPKLTHVAYLQISSGVELGVSVAIAYINSTSIFCSLSVCDSTEWAQLAQPHPVWIVGLYIWHLCPSSFFPLSVWY